MTLPSIGATLERNHLDPVRLSEAEAKAIVYDAIRTDLAKGLEWLRSFRHYAWSAIPEQHETCVHCAIKDLEVRKQVIRLAAYTGLREFVREELGLLVALHNFRPTSGANADEGPSARIIIEPATRQVSQPTTAVVGHSLKPRPAFVPAPGQLKVSPEQSWQIMNWGKMPAPPALLSRAEAEALIWDWAELHCSRGLAWLRDLVASGHEGDDAAAAPGELIGEMIQLVGVPGIQQVVAKNLGVAQFHFYNCCMPVRPKGPAFSWRLQLRNQANEAMMDC